MLARLSAFVIWALVAATAVFWGLRLMARAPAAPAYAVAVGDAAAVRGDLSRLLGKAPVAPVAANAPPPEASRFKLIGIVAPKNVPASGEGPTHGVALIAVDGKMPKAFAVGSRLDGDLVLHAVSMRTASIGANGAAPSITLELPPLAAPATGTLPPGATEGPAGPMTLPSAMPQYQPPPTMQAQPVPPPGANMQGLAPPRPEPNAPAQ